ncbi:MAG: HAD hydrolase family protein [Butyricicoccaceae bacterium]
MSPENEKLCVTTDKNYLPYAPENYFPVLWDPHFDYHRLEHLYKVYYVCTPDEENHIDAGGLPLVRYNPHVIFVEPKEKQRGIRYFQQLLSIPDEDIVVFGDGMNDICMFGQGWLSIAMGNARAALKEKADYITTDVDKDGLWNACRHFGWI